ncbi:hypothetical protein T261_00902 [Streptomyces lydicus]|nr:hypothetical protein T261_00902 [Streptomyces lydicus]
METAWLGEIAPAVCAEVIGDQAAFAAAGEVTRGDQHVRDGERFGGFGHGELNCE